MLEKKALKKAIAAPLESAGMPRKGQAWYHDGPDAIAVLELQKNDWADEYFINFGIWLKPLGEAQFPRENDCHVSDRLDGLFPEARTIIHDGASLDGGNSETLRGLALFLATQVVPFMRKCTVLNELRALYRAGRFRQGFVSKEARSILSGDN